MLDGKKLMALFYYCLKRTGNREAAEDLSSEISLEILKMLNRGYTPVNFNAWMWTVAKAKYAAWAKSKKTLYENVIIGDISNIVNIVSDDDVERAVIKEEDIRLLRRELAIMSKEYREITVAYYIDNKKISEISKKINMPEGTVKRKLSESRKYLREGVKMTRAYGTRSYSPENINFIVNRSNPKDDAPYSAIKSKLAKNILLEAYTNPCSIEELSISLGVASPYLEEETDKLVECLLLTKVKNKYETDFIILDKETQKDIISKTIETAEKICAELFVFTTLGMGLPTFIETMSAIARNEYRCSFSNKYINEWLEKSDAEHNISGREEYGKSEAYLEVEEALKEGLLKWKEDYPDNKTTAGIISSEEAIWFYLFKTIRDMIVQTEFAKNISQERPKKYKGEWSITGFEEYNENELLTYEVGMDWDNTEKIDKHLFKFYFKGFSRTKLTLRDFDLIVDILKNDKKFSDLSDNEKDMILDLVKRELVIINDDTIKTAFPILFTSGIQDLEKIIDGANYPETARKFDESVTAITKKSLEICQTAIFELYECNFSLIKRNLPEHLAEQAKFCARDMLSYLNSAILKISTEKNYLMPADKPVGIGGYVVS